VLFFFKSATDPVLTYDVVAFTLCLKDFFVFFCFFWLFLESAPFLRRELSFSESYFWESYYCGTEAEMFEETNF